MSAVVSESPLLRAGFVQFLQSRGVITSDQKKLLFEQVSQGSIPLVAVVAGTGLPESALYEHLSSFSNLPLESSSLSEATGPALKAIPVSVCRKYHLLPVSVSPSSLKVATAAPLPERILKKIETYTNRSDISQALVPFSALQQRLDEIYDARKGGRRRTPVVAKGPTQVRDYLTENIDPAKVPDLVDQLVIEAMQAGASDLHFEPKEKYFGARMRVDGLLREVCRFPREFMEPVISRLKVMSQADITEKYVPQDGRFTINARDIRIDVRSSFFRTVQGEKAALRLVDANQKRQTIAQLGFERDQMDQIVRIIQQPYGMVLVTGPTGSGKTTTIFSFLDHLNREDINITTIEDPNEYVINGINQCSLNKPRGLDFHKALRAMLRQDPDIIMLGEIRDEETAEIAFHAALTGHLVFATIHTNDSISSVGRVLNLGIDKTICSIGLNGIISQRLVRKVCPSCMEIYEPEDALKATFGLSEFPDVTFARGIGCDQCQGRGVRGRAAMYEIVEISDKIQDAIQLGATSHELYEVARQTGWSPLRFSGVRKLLNHETTVEEILAATVAR